MAIIFIQEDTAATCGAAIYCSSLSVDAITQIVQSAVQGGTAGVTEDVSGNMTNSDSTIYRMLYFDLTVPSGMYGGTGDAGNWTVRINHSTGDADIDIEEVHICRVALGSCANQETLGSTTAIATATNGAQPVSVVVNQGSNTSVATDDRVLVIVGYQNNAAHGNNSIGVTPSVNIDCPWTVPPSAGQPFYIRDSYTMPDFLGNQQG